MMELTFLPPSTEQCATIQSSPDTLLENNETFTVQLSTLDQDIILGISSAPVTIVDDDSEFHKMFMLTSCNIGQASGVRSV